MIDHVFDPGPVHLLRLAPGVDLLESLTAYVGDKDIAAGSLTFLGAVRRAALRYYDQRAREYRDFEVDRPLEIAAGVGNVSLLDGRPFIHAHMIASDADGTAIGGHINVGTEVFVCEVTLLELDGEPPVRDLDVNCGLPLWGGTL